MSITISSSVISFTTATPLPNNFLARREAAHRRALADHRLRPASTKVFGFILEQVNRQSGGWKLCIKTIAAGTSMGERNARRCVAELEKHGYLRRISDPGHANFYQVWESDPGQNDPGGRTNLSGVPRTELSANTFSSSTSEPTSRRNEDALSVPRKGKPESKQASATPKPSPSKNGNVPRAAAPGEVPPADDVLIEYDTPDADLAARYMGRALGKPFLRYGRARGIYLSRAEHDAIKALAAAEGAAS